MKTQGVQKGRQTLHQQQDGDGQVGPEEPEGKHNDAAIVLQVHLQPQAEHHVPQHLRQLCRRGVRKEGKFQNCTLQQHILNCYLNTKPVLHAPLVTGGWGKGGGG